MIYSHLTSSVGTPYIVFKDNTTTVLRYGDTHCWSPSLDFNNKDHSFKKTPLPESYDNDSIEYYLKFNVELLLTLNTEEELYNLKTTHPELFI